MTGTMIQDQGQDREEDSRLGIQDSRPGKTGTLIQDRGQDRKRRER